MATDMGNYEKYGGGSEISLKGIVKLEKDENGKVGLEIPDLLTINNQEYQAGSESLGTNGNLCLLDPTADLLRINPNVVTLTYLQEGSRNEKYYADDQGFKYYLTTTPELAFVGEGDPSTGEISTISKAPTWNKDTTFFLSDTLTETPLKGIICLLFSETNSSTITVPKTVSEVLPMSNIVETTLQNFSGTLDASAVTLLDHNFKNIGTGCTEGTIVVNAETYTNLESRISSGMLDGKIKIQQEEGQ